MSHGEVMKIMARKKEPMTKGWAKVLKEDIKLDEKELKAKAQSKAMKKCMK